MLRVIRIPVSLKFNEDDFYMNYIEPLKEGKGLSSFIVSLLKLYYTNDLIRDEVDRCQQLDSPFTEIKDQIDRITLEHEKTVMAIGGLKDFVRNKKFDFTEEDLQLRGLEIKNRLVGIDSKDVDDGSITERIGELEKLSLAINDNLQKIVQLRLDKRIGELEKEIPFIKNGLQNVMHNNQIHSSKMVQKSDSVIVNDEIKGNMDISIEQYPEKEISSDVEENASNKEKYIDNSVSFNDIGDFVTEEENNLSVKDEKAVNNMIKDTVKGENIKKEGDKVNKPASFGKLMKSLKNE